MTARALAVDPEGTLEQIEIDLLLEGVFRHYGFDFRKYAMASLRRRVANMMENAGAKTVSQLQDLVLHDPAAMEQLLRHLSVNTTTMFRDPKFYLVFREQVVPL